MDKLGTCNYFLTEFACKILKNKNWIILKLKNKVLKLNKVRNSQGMVYLVWDSNYRINN